MDLFTLLHLSGQYLLNILGSIICSKYGYVFIFKKIKELRFNRSLKSFKSDNNFLHLFFLFKCFKSARGSMNYM